jgi:hypothetical protein
MWLLRQAAARSYFKNLAMNLLSLESSPGSLEREANNFDIWDIAQSFYKLYNLSFLPNSATIILKNRLWIDVFILCIDGNVVCGIFLSLESFAA